MWKMIKEQNQKVIEELEKVRELLFENAMEITGTSVACVRLCTIIQIIEQEIERLKKKGLNNEKVFY